MLQNSETENSLQDKAQRFQNLGKNLFEFIGDSKNLFFDSIHDKLNYRFSNKDTKYNDFIVPPRAISLILIYDTALLKNYETWLKIESSVNTASLSVYTISKDYYFRWAIAKDISEKVKNKNLLEEVCNKNIDDRIFLVHIFLILINLSENRIDNEIPDNLLKIQRIIDQLKLDSGIKNKISYLINLLFAIYYSKVKDISYSKIKFTEALNFTPSGLTAKYYLALLELKSGNYEDVMQYVKEIFYFDAERIIKSIEYKNFKQYLLYIKSAEFNHILAENEFIPITYELESFVKEINDKINISPIILDNFVRRIKKMELEELYDENTKNYLTFLDTVLIYFLSKENFHFKVSLQYLREVLNDCVNQLISAVKNDYNKMMEKKLEVFDYQMADDYEEIIRLQNTMEKDKSNIEVEISVLLQNMDREITKTINDCKIRLEKIGTDEKYNIRKVFSNAMLYNTIISFIIIIIGGFFNLTKNPDGSEAAKLGDIAQYAIEAGFKWGGAVFFCGCIISIVMVVITIINKNHEKTSLIKNIRNQAQMKAEETAKIRSSKERELNSKLEKLNNKVEAYKRHVELVKQEKKHEELLLKENENSRIEDYTKQLKEILSS